MLICPYLSCKARKADNFLFFRQFTYSFKAAPYTECGFAVILCLYLPPTPSTPNLKKENLVFATGRTVLPSPMLRRCRSGAAHARQNRRGRARVFRFATQNERAARQSRAAAGSASPARKRRTPLHYTDYVFRRLRAVVLKPLSNYRY